MARKHKILTEREELKKLVDELAIVKESRKAYERREALLLERMKKYGVGRFEGTFFDVETTREWKPVTDWDGLYLAHRSVQKWISDFTRSQPSLVTRIKPKVAETLQSLQ